VTIATSFAGLGRYREAHVSDAVDGTFPVKIVFRGLFLASREEDHIDVFLPDASSPGAAIKAETDPKRRALLEALQPLREHQAVVEFPLADWDNRSELTPRLLRVHKPTKEPVALYLLRKESVELGGLYEDPHDLPMPLKVANARAYKQVGTGIRLLAKHPELGWNQLAGFESDLNEPEELDRVCAATTVIRFGEVYSERRSLRGEVERRWQTRSVLCEEYLAPGVREASGLPKAPPDGAPRRLNLDLVVRFRLRESNPLQIVCTPRQAGPVPRAFILRPRTPGAEVTVWIKNRELDAVLRDSDLVPDTHLLVDTDHDATDRDHAIYMRLAKDPAKLRVPRDDNDDASDSGSGCGGVVRPPEG
jgi:hypothetical protein